MELDSFDLQIFVSLSAFLAVALTALIVDFLKERYHQSRHLSLELQVLQQNAAPPIAGLAVIRVPHAVAPLAPVRAFGVLPAILVNSPSMPPTVGLTLTGELMTLAPVKVSGLVVLIGIHDLAGMRENEGHAAVEEMMHSVAKMVKSLMRSENDFMCKAKDDEFLLVLGDESGASAQRRLVAISEKLWDFQLRSLGTVFVLFNWASVEVQNEALADAFASAADRMHQTRRNRKTNSMDIAWMRRKAV